MAGECELYYWREGNREVDFVARAGRVLTAIEVKSGRPRLAQPGLTAFAEAFKPKRTLVVGSGGIPVEEFLARPVAHWGS
jgi:predicted AAA+ superfamily ATPase